MNEKLHWLETKIVGIVAIICIFSVITSYYKLDKKFNEIKYTQSTKNLGCVKVFRYSNLVKQTDKSPNITASGEYVQEGMIAVSRDFIESGELQFGDNVFLVVAGKKQFYKVADVMNRRHTRSVDIFTFKKTGLNKLQKGRLYLMEVK